MRVVFILLAMLTLMACREKKIVSEEELKAYVMDPENGLRQQKESNGIDVEVIYRPSELVLAQQLDGMTNAAERINTIKNFDSLSYFVVKLSRKGQEVENVFVSDNEKFVRVINYLSSAIAQNIYIINDKDTIPALDAVYARMFGAATSTSVMAVFDTDFRKRNGDLRFFLDDTELGLGQNEFAFTINDIKKAPTLNLN
jgi:hypothetical protein